MKKLISESEISKIKKMNSIEEGWFSDIIDTIKNSDAIKSITKKFKELTGVDVDKKDESGEIEKKFKELTGVDFDEKEESGEVTKDYKSYKIGEPSNEDIKFYEKVLDKLGAPNTKENMTFFYAWRQAEGAKSSYNPFNTTHSMPNSTFWNCLKKKDGKCVGGVRNYKTENDGIEATVKTLTNGRYECIVNGLKNNKGANEIAKCSSLNTWGTREGISRVLNTGKINPPEISRSLVKKV
jgi:hypothetical protein